MIKQVEELFGRQLNSREVAANVQSDQRCLRRPAIQKQQGRWRCQRCGSVIRPKATKLGDDRFYCATCIQMGRLVSTDQMCFADEPNWFNYTDCCAWLGELTVPQADGAQKVIEVIEQRQSHLLWAVTGAGKTEMLFRGLEYAFRHQLRVALVSPRIDVVLELAPRIRAAFPTVTSVLLYGESPEDYRYSQLVLATTHQLLRFYHAFDVIVVDEVDVFPLAGNEQLHFAIGQAGKPRCAFIYLTATPDKTLKRQLKNRKLSVSYLPGRYHGFPLPTITNCRVGDWRTKMGRGRLPLKLVQDVQRRIGADQPFLLFVPHVADLQLVSDCLMKQRIAGEIFLTVHAGDPDRVGKVQRMRAGEILFLITTTILERGVTFPAIDVLVLGADDAIFSAAALIQIAGRVGRKPDRPTGAVNFYNQKNSSTIRQAQREIQMMNRKAGFHG